MTLTDAQAMAERLIAANDRPYEVVKETSTKGLRFGGYYVKRMPR